MFATFRPIGNIIHVKLAERPQSENDFNKFMADWLACYHRNHTSSFIFIIDARQLSWYVWDFRYLIQMQSFLKDLQRSHLAFPETYDKLKRCYVASASNYPDWIIQLLCTYQSPISPVYMVEHPQRAQDLEALRAFGIPINRETAPDVFKLCGHEE